MILCDRLLHPLLAMPTPSLPTHSHEFVRVPAYNVKQEIQQGFISVLYASGVHHARPGSAGYTQLPAAAALLLPWFWSKHKRRSQVGGPLGVCISMIGHVVRKHCSMDTNLLLKTVNSLTRCAAHGCAYCIRVTSAWQWWQRLIASCPYVHCPPCNVQWLETGRAAGRPGGEGSAWRRRGGGGGVRAGLGLSQHVVLHCASRLQRGCSADGGSK